MEFITEFQNVYIENDVYNYPLSGTLTDLTNFIIKDTIERLQKRFPFHKNFPNIYGKFIRVNLNPYLFYMYACQLIRKYKIGHVVKQDFKQDKLKSMMFTNRYQKDFYPRFENLKQDIAKNLNFTSKFCGKLKYNRDFDTHEYGIFDFQTINSDDIDLNGFKFVCRTFGIKPDNLTMTDDNHLIKTYAKKIVDFHVLLELYQTIIHPKMLELLTEYTESFILCSCSFCSSCFSNDSLNFNNFDNSKNLKQTKETKETTQTKNLKETILIDSKHFKKYKFTDSKNKNIFAIYNSNLFYESDFSFDSNDVILPNISKKPNINQIINHLETIKALYGAILNFNQPSFVLQSYPSETEIFDFVLDYRMYENKYLILFS